MRVGILAHFLFLGFVKPECGRENVAVIKKHMLCDKYVFENRHGLEQADILEGTRHAHTCDLIRRRVMTFPGTFSGRFRHVASSSCLADGWR